MMHQLWETQVKKKEDEEAEEIEQTKGKRKRGNFLAFIEALYAD